MHVFAALLLAATLDAQAYYRLALQRMVNLPEPPVVSYTATIHATGSRFYVSVEPETGLAEFGFSIGSALGVNSASWLVSVQTANAITRVDLDGTAAVTRYPIFDATWWGAYVWLRYGFNGRSLATPSPSTSPTELESELGIIAVVRAIDPGAYRIIDRGNDTCENGDAARHMRLVAYSDPDRYPASDITIDVKTNDICTMGFDLRPTQFLAQTGNVQLHFTNVNGYPLVTDGRIQMSTKFHGLGKRKVEFDLQYTNVTFPKA